MRVRTDEKRQRIVEVATDLFLELGYERTSMSLISQRLGGSKATLYGYFRSKEELLLAVLDTQVETQADELMGRLLQHDDLEQAFAWLGRGYLDRRLSIRPTLFFRIISSQPESTGIGLAFYERVIRPAWMRLCDRLEKLMEEGRLRRADPWTATMQLKGLLEGDLVDQRLLGARADFDEAVLDRRAAEAAACFMRLYRPD